MSIAAWACGIGGSAAVLGSFGHWVRATLSDRGAQLLVVTRSGWDLPPSGQVVFTLGLVTLGCVLLSDPGDGRRWPRIAPPITGAAVIAVTVDRIGAARPIAHIIGRMRIGTFQTDHPTATTGTGFGLWICLAGGALMLVAGTAWLILDRSTGTRTP